KGAAVAAPPLPAKGKSSANGKPAASMAKSGANGKSNGASTAKANHKALVDSEPPRALKGKGKQQDIDDDDDEPSSDRPPAAGKKKGKGKDVNDLINLGKSKGFLTYAEVNEALPADDVDPEQMDDVLNVLDNEDIEIVDETANLKIAPAKSRMADDEAPSRGSKSSSNDEAPATGTPAKAETED